MEPYDYVNDVTLRAAGFTIHARGKGEPLWYHRDTRKVMTQGLARKYALFILQKATEPDPLPIYQPNRKQRTRS